MNRPFTVAVGVCTYKRPELLALIIADLQAQVFDNLRPVSVTIFVVDNDAAGSAAAVVEAMNVGGTYPCRYICQPRKGLSSVRNTALAAAADFDYIAFVDDDERVSPSWLTTLCEAAQKTGAVFVIGPVRPLFPDDCPDYFVRSGLFHREEFTDGQPIATGNTGNAFLSNAFLKAKQIQFKSQFEESGGEDTCFFADIVAAGGRGVYALGAAAYEPVAKDRLSIKWLIRRRCRFGTTEVMQANLRAKKTGLINLQYFGKGVYRILAGALMAIVVLPLNQGKSLKYACAGARGYGYLLGVFGVNIKEY